MRFSSILAVVLVTALATSALAAPTLPGINVRWDNCVADGGVMNKVFACDSNAGSDLLVFSLQLDTPMSPVSGMEIRISLKPSVPVLPAWWDFKKSPVSSVDVCRPASLNFIPSPTLPFAGCADWGEGRENGGIGAYRADELGPGSAVILIASAVPSVSLVQQLDPVTEYVVGALSMNHAKTVGAGSCGGCNTPVCILFTSLDVTTPVLANDRLFTQGANGAESQMLLWQDGQLTNLVNHCTGTFDCTTQFNCMANLATAARHNTWGEVKALYR